MRWRSVVRVIVKLSSFASPHCERASSDFGLRVDHGVRHLECCPKRATPVDPERLEDDLRLELNALPILRRIARLAILIPVVA